MVKFNLFYEGDLRTKAVHTGNGSLLETDAPQDNQGKGELFSPTDLLAVSLGTCIVTTLQLIAQRLKVELKEVRATVEKEMSSTLPRKIAKVVVHVFCSAVLDLAMIASLEKGARGCPVHQSLHPDVVQEIVFHWGEK